MRAHRPIKIVCAAVTAVLLTAGCLFADPLVGDSLTVTGDADIGGELSVTGNSDLGNNTMTVLQNEAEVQVNGDLTVTGTIETPVLVMHAVSWNDGGIDYNSQAFLGNLFYAPSLQLNFSDLTNNTATGWTMTTPWADAELEPGRVIKKSTLAFGLDSDHVPFVLVPLVIMPSGNVGIGTLDPQSKLAVNGTITAKEIVVTLAGWADYVFEKDYQLPSLDETAAYIQENGHLPGIPSAREIKQEGLPMAEMMAKQMEKIEELTLYLIDMKQENEALKARMAALEAAE